MWPTVLEYMHLLSASAVVSAWQKNKIHGTQKSGHENNSMAKSFKVVETMGEGEKKNESASVSKKNIPGWLMQPFHCQKTLIKRYERPSGSDVKLLH